ncbi:MAG: hypothetical protein V9F82_07430 [Dermatophilaceae bacterium]
MKTAVVTLRTSSDEVNHQLAHEITERLQIAGIEVIEARINNLAYSTEIAQAPCCNASKPPPSWRPVAKSWKAQWVWSKWRWNNSRAKTSSTWTRRKKPLWSATSWWFFAAIETRNPSLTPVPYTINQR